jgi:hypothetical protein
MWLYNSYQSRKAEAMAVDRIKHTKPASRRTFLDELEPIPYEISEEELARMDPRMREILFGIKEDDSVAEDISAAEPDEEIAGDDTEELTEDTEIIEEDVSPPEEPEEKEEQVSETEEDTFDYYKLAEFPDDVHPSVTLIFHAENSEEEIINLAKSGSAYRAETVGDRTWHAARFGRAEAEPLRALNALLGDRQDMLVMFNGRRVPFGRSLWLPMMYIFTSAEKEKQD